MNTYKVTFVWTRSIEVECDSEDQANQLGELWLSEAIPQIVHDTEWDTELVK